MSLRGLSKELDRSSHAHSIPKAIQLNPSPNPVQVFRGFTIPEEPKPPADDGAFLSSL